MNERMNEYQYIASQLIYLNEYQIFITRDSLNILKSSFNNQKKKENHRSIIL